MPPERPKSIGTDAPGASAPCARDEVLNQTTSFWQPYSHRELTSEDARQIRENLVGFFRILQSWERTKGELGRKERQAA